MSSPHTPSQSPNSSADTRVARDNHADLEHVPVQSEPVDEGGRQAIGRPASSEVGAGATAAAAAAEAESPSNGHADEAPPDGGEAPRGLPDGASDSADGPSESAAPRGAEKQEAVSPGPGDADRKRRKRRRKKKPDSRALEESSARETPDAAEGAREGQATEIVGAAGEKGQAKGKKKDKHAGYPRERPPVNGGDIIFGKILEIGEDAIFIDIPGKARAIFDRSEMLLPDDDDAHRPDRSPSRAEIAPPPPPSAIDASVGSAAAFAEPADQAPPAAGVTAAVDSTREESNRATDTEAQPALDAEKAASADRPGRSVPPAPADAATSEPPVAEPPRDAPREPKVPRVILEVGADFIGVVHNDGARGGLVVLTHHPNRAERAKLAVEKAFADKTSVLALVTGVIKGGVEVDVEGLRAFAPGSHVDLRLGADLSHLVGRRMPFLVTQYAKRGRDVVLSRRHMLEEEARRVRAEALSRLKVGEDLDGLVRSVVPFGAFVDVGGIEGLVPLQEMSHNRTDGPSDVFKAGEPTRVRVVKIDDRGKIWLSRKATIPDPWQQVAQKYAVGTRHSGKVARLQPFGAFIELEPGVDGLVHTQDLSIKRIESPADVVKVGDPIEVVVSHVDPTQHKIALHPAPQGDAAAEAPQRIVPHKPVKAKVVTIESGGLVVRILGVTGRNARGYVTAAGTGTPRGTELRKAFNVGQEIEAKVIEMDPRRGEVKLSIKALGEDQERSAYQQYRQQLKAEARFTFGDLLAKKGK